MDLLKQIDQLKSIKLSGGVFGKTTTLMVVLTICLSVISIKIELWWITLVLMLPVMGIVFYSLKRILDFVEKNPQAAIMEGAELLIYEKLNYAHKNQVLKNNFDESTFDHEPAKFEVAEIGLPDPNPQLDLPEGVNTEEEAN